MKNLIMFRALDSALKSISKVKLEKDKVHGYKFILDRATSMLKLVNYRLENMKSKTDKKLKKEKDKIKLNEKINSHIEKENELVEKFLKEEYLLFKNEFDKMKKLLTLGK